MAHTAFHWPDHVIGQRESREIREAHNALYNDYHELLEAVRGLFRECSMIHSKWGNSCNRKEASAAIEAARAAIAKAEGRAEG